MKEPYELTDGYFINRVLNGLWQLSPGHTLQGQLDLADIQDAFDQLAQLGFTTFDLADIYTGAEDALGQFLKRLKNHSYLTVDDIQIHEKYVPDKDVLETVNLQDTEAIIDRSLQKLGRDYIDLMQFHWWDYDIPRYVEVADHLLQLQKKGKIRYIGVTNYDTAHLKELVDAGIPIVSCQSQYSVFDRRPEKGLIKYCQQVGIEQICFGTLCGGLLAEKYIGAEGFNAETRSQVKYQQVIEQTLGFEGWQELLVLLKDLAVDYQVDIAHIANRYILQKEGVAATIIGLRNSKHVQSNQKILEFELEDTAVQVIDQFLEQYPILQGEPYELERTPDSVFQSIIRMNENANEQ